MVTTDVQRVERALSEVDFPANKDDLVRCATDAKADEDTVRALRAIPPVAYANMTEVLQSVTLDDGRTEAQRMAQSRDHAHPGVAERDREVPPNPIVEELGENRDS
ncbi:MULTISPECIES: DUF2795 domain-containing protein [Nocardia]|uniref:Uncharacterized protein DUF2795 n=2 Tax=Nocardia TaxID=1817 RepID=A0A4R6P4V0_NOCIG|nr:MULTISPECIES: DUF2795 domain-containing protein [Nocardia]NKX85891.1 DUF2795 domain-containing protein [Nocardia coubleae]TDP32050.1 uncharacterized protein DUF2795 [Nocardia ignorata]